jgi:hypothetical protein
MVFRDGYPFKLMPMCFFLAILLDLGQKTIFKNAGETIR